MQFGIDKFYPPPVETPRFLIRERIVGDILRRCGASLPIIVVEAQAGQGKTTLARQFLIRLGVDSAWYQIGPDDADPACFLASIRTCLAGQIPGLPPVAGGGDVTPLDLPRLMGLLLEDIRSSLERDLYLVFDDLHHLIGHAASLFLLDHLVNGAPGRLHFVLSSREPLPLAAWSPASGSAAPIRLGNRDLALDEDEIADFFQRVFELPVPQDTVRRAGRLTDGWVMGIVLLGLRLSRGGAMTAPDGQAGMGQAEILDYFRRTVFETLEPALHEPLLRLSLLEEIPVELARAVTAMPDIGAGLERLARRNIFIRQLDPDATIYGLHHLFRQFLREKAGEILEPREIREVYRLAGQHYAGRGNPAQALRSYLLAGDHEAMESVLRQSGTAMLAANQTATLAAILSEVPEAVMAGLGWAAFYLALARLDVAPALALPLLYKALGVFSDRRDELGELLCLAHIISIHITTTGHYREGEGLLARAEEIFSRTAASLDTQATILLARSLAMGHCIFLADTATATRYAMLALNLARKEGLVNFEAALLMVMGYIRIFAGHTSLARLWLEQAAAVMNRPEVGTFNSLAIRMMLFNFLYIDGDFPNYFDQKNQLVAAIGNELVSQSIAGPFCYIWEMDIALNEGRPEDALRLAALALDLNPPLSPHLHGQILQLKAAALALCGQPVPALEAIAESTRLRERSGGPYFVALNRLMAGLTYGLCGNHQQASALLTDGIESARRMPTPYLEACGLMHRGWVHMDAGDPERAASDIAAGLGLMRQHAYRHFWGWTPGAIREMLGFAVARGTESAYARELAVERIGVGFGEDGSALPLLTFRVLGGFAILRGGETVLEAEALTPAQRELLCLLLASPGLKMAQDIAQLHFWPDSSAAAAKTKFDTMVSRLRKTLAEALPDHTAQCYLHRDKGIIRLAHCRVDALEFQTLAERGLEHFRLQEFWQAGNDFARADSLWRGDFAPGVTGEDQVRGFRDSLSRSMTRLALAWGGMLAESGRLRQAMDVTEKALRTDPLSEALWALLYRLNGRLSAVQARQALKRYAALLRAEDYAEGEIAEMLRGIACKAGTTG